MSERQLLTADTPTRLELLAELSELRTVTERLIAAMWGATGYRDRVAHDEAHAALDAAEAVLRKENEDGR